MLPIEMATKNKHSKAILHDLLKRDMPLDMSEKAEAKPVPHQYSWNHIVSESNDMYYDVVEKVLQHCTQPQVLALAHVENRRGEIALATATPLCKHEFRVMFRLFHTLEVVDQTPAYEDKETGTQLFYALRFTPPKEKFGYFTSLYIDEPTEMNYLEEWDGSAIPEEKYAPSDLSMISAEEKLDFVQSETGVKVIAKLTCRSDVADLELSRRKDFNLSRHYVPAIMSIHHTTQHAAYSEAMAEPSYCITMEAADITAENLILDTRKSGGVFPKEDLKGIAMSLLHIHEHGLVHGDFGSQNVARFGSRWKTLGIRGSIPIGEMTDPKRGFFQPPEAISLETRNVSLGDKNVGASVVSVAADPTFDIWSYGVIFYEAVAGLPLSPYRSLNKGKRALTIAELFKVGQWDERSLRKALRHIRGPKDSPEKELVKLVSCFEETAVNIARLMRSVLQLLHPNPNARAQSMRDVLEHPFFGLGKLAGKAPVFARPNLDTSARSNSVEIDQYTEEHMAKRNEIISQSEVGEKAVVGEAVKTRSAEEDAKREAALREQKEAEKKAAEEVEAKRQAAEMEKQAQAQKEAAARRADEERRRKEDAAKAEAAEAQRKIEAASKKKKGFGMGRFGKKK